MTDLKYTGSIKKRLTLIILLVVFITGLIGYSSFVYWYMNDQHKRALNLSKTVTHIISQDVAKLVLLNNVSAAADITSGLKSFESLNSMVLYKLDKTPIYQYNKADVTFQVKQLNGKPQKNIIIEGNKLKSYIDAKYQDTHLGYVELNFEIKTILDVVKQNINTLIVILMIMILVSYILAIYFAKRFNQPILNLVSFLEQIGLTESLKKRIYTQENNEFGKLYDEVNTMLERLQKSHEALKIAAVAFETQNGMTITDANNKILQVNKAFTNITGYEPHEVIGHTPAILKSGLHKEEFYNDMYSTLQKNHYWSGEVANKHKDGSIIKEYLTIQVVLNDLDEIKYYVASFSDITLQKEIEKKLQEKEIMLIQQSKMADMGEMIGNIAHQWRQPLAAIVASATGMKLKKEMGISQENEEIELFDKINDSAQYLSKTIDDFRDFFKPNKEKKLFNLKDLYLKTSNIISSKFKNKDITIEENIKDIEILCYDSELIQVIMNLLNNAHDALESNENQEKLIFIDIYSSDHHAFIKIRDNAGGIDESIVDKVFDPYFTTKHQTKGTGIGLYMSQEIITKHMKGSLDFKNLTFEFNNNQYTGVEFTITLPLKDVE